MSFRTRSIVLLVVCAAGFLVTNAAANPCSAKQDQTLTPRTSGSKVVEAAVQKIHESGIFPDDNQFLRRIAYVESKDGTDPNTYRDGYYGGIWQVDQIAFQDTQNTKSHPGLIEKFAKIKQKFGIDWTTVTWRDLEKPFYSALAARLFLSNINEKIPSSSEKEEQASYWKTYYNTPSGSGTEQKFIMDVMALNQTTSQECRTRGSDVIFVLDSSGSVGSVNFQKTKDFAVNVVEQFTIGPQDTRVGVIVFSSIVDVSFSLDTYNTSSGVISEIQQTPYIGQGTNTSGALDVLVEEFAIGRQGLPKIAIVVTDGMSNNFNATLLSAQKVHENNIITFAVGVGSNVDQDELEAIAGDTGQVKNISGFDVTELDSLQVDLNLAACLASAISEVEEPISSTVEKDQEVYYQYNDFPEEGITLKLNATSGSLVMYATDKTSNPNEAFYDVRVETSSYADVYINYTTLYGQCLSAARKRQASTLPDISEITLYVTITGQANTSNSFTLNTTFSDTSTTPGTTTTTTIAATTPSTAATTPSTAATTPSTDTGLSSGTIGTIVGGTMGGVVALLLLAACACVIVY